MSRALITLGLTCALLAAPAADVSAQGASPSTHSPGERLARARVCYAALDFECAAIELREARANLSALDAGEGLEVLRLSAEVALASERRAEALEHLSALLARSPEFSPAEGAWPAPWLAALAEARRRAPDRSAPVVTLLESAPPQAGAAAEVVAQIVDKSGVVRATLNIAQTRGAAVSVAMATSDGELWRASVPAELVRLPTVSVWVEAWDRQGNGPGRAGSAEAPLPLRVAPRAEVEQSAYYETWWFWTAVGAVAVGGGVAIGLLASGGEGAGPPGFEFGDALISLDFLP